MCVKNIEGMLGDIDRINGKVVENKNDAYFKFFKDKFDERFFICRHHVYF